MVNITQCKSPNAQTEDPTPVSGLDEIARLVQRSCQLLVLTGAGCSTESGIPDYRDREGAWKRKQPMSYQEFIRSHEAQQRYWARAAIGWKRLRSVRTADALLVVGSSLMVYSAYRLVRAAHDLGLPIMIINRGKTRADTLASSKLEGQCGLILERLEAIMMGSKAACDG